jgi:hypothetical protein
LIGWSGDPIKIAEKPVRINPPRDTGGLWRFSGKERLFRQEKLPGYMDKKGGWIEG